MKTVFSSHSEVAHIWASQSQGYGRGGNVFFENGTIYSYGHHFAVARFAPEYGDIVLFTNRGYSNSTAKHKGLIRGAIPLEYRVVYCFDPSITPKGNLDKWQAQIDSLRQEFAKKKHKISRGNIALKIEQLIDEVTIFCDATKIPLFAWLNSSIDEIQARDYVKKLSIERQAKQEIKRELLRQEYATKARDRLDLWAIGENVLTHDFHLCDTLLRIKGDQIQTSRGANIPVNDAISIYPLLARAKQSGKPLDLGLRTVNLGVYKFHSFENDVLTVGCHKIKWDQIQKMAMQLNLIN